MAECSRARGLGPGHRLSCGTTSDLHASCAFVSVPCGLVVEINFMFIKPYLCSADRMQM